MPHPIREKYPDSHHDPDPGCRKCKGEGEWLFVSNTKSEFFSNDPYMTPCMCIFVEHEFVQEAGKALAEVAKQCLDEMDIPGSPTWHAVETSVRLADFLTKIKSK